MRHFTDEQIREIAERYQRGRQRSNIDDLAKRYGISRAHAYMIVSDRLSDGDILAIRHEYIPIGPPQSLKSLAKEYGVSPSVISRIVGAPGTGPRTRVPKLSPDDAEAIRRAYRDGETYRSIANRFQVSRTTISRVVHGRLYPENQESTGADANDGNLDANRSR